MNTIQQTPAGKVPLDYLMWLRGIRNIDLAEKTGIAQQEFSRYRNGLKPPEDRRKKIAKALKVSQAELGWEVHDG